jgi:regulator of protease activity HflC (stomatin/prohibitin superfamily)
LKIWKIKIGPNFSTDIIDVRTKDNAVLKIRLRYQWKFIVDDNQIEEAFNTGDFVGLMTEMIASIIRDEAAKYDFEQLHSRASEIVKTAIFGKAEFYEFDNGLRVFGIDIKEITPKDEEIAHKMNEAIKSNMQIYVNKMKQMAEIEAEKTKIDGQITIEKETTSLIKIQNENLRKKEIIVSEIEAEKIKIRAQAEADSSKVLSEVKIEALKEEIKVLEDASEEYIKLRNIEGLSNINKMVIIPTDSKIFLPTDLLK